MAIQFVLSPQTAWESVTENRPGLYRSFLLPIWGVIIIVSFTGGWLLNVNGSVGLGIRNMIFEIFSLFASFHMSSFLLNEYAGKLTDIGKNIDKARVFVAYSSSIIYLVEIAVAIFDDFFFLWLFVLYTFYIVYAGAEEYYKITSERRTNFMIITSLLILIMPFIMKSVLSMMTKI